MVIRMKGIKRVISKGHVYYYHRKSGIRIPGEPGTTEFMNALAAVGTKKADKKIAAKVVGSLGALLAKYQASPEFASRADRTRSDYAKVFSYLAPLDAMALAQIDGAFLYGVRDKANARKKRRFANYVVQVLSIVFNWGKTRGLCRSNPAADVEEIARPKNAPPVNRPWSDEEVATVMREAPPDLKVAIAIGCYIGMRQADMLKMTWAAYDGSAIEIRQNKTGEPLWVPAHRELRAILDEAKKTRTGTQIAIGPRGKVWSQSGFQSRFFVFLKRLRDAGKIGPGLSFHGLRHTVGNRLAELGCDARTIAAVLGQITSTMGEHYSRHANRRVLVGDAIRLMEGTKKPEKRKTARKSFPSGSKNAS